jgi:alpha-tubulin suppressor-like RCC1 family protein
MGAELDFDSRRLCPDGACIGVIGSDGRCRVCGKRDDGALQGTLSSGADTETDDDTEDRDLDDADDHEAAVRMTLDGAVVEIDDGEDRKLCRDEACVGLVGSDGRCKICGTYAGS